MQLINFDILVIFYETFATTWTEVRKVRLENSLACFPISFSFHSHRKFFHNHLFDFTLNFKSSGISIFSNNSKSLSMSMSSGMSLIEMSLSGLSELILFKGFAWTEISANVKSTNVIKNFMIFSLFESWFC